MLNKSKIKRLMDKENKKYPNVLTPMEIPSGIEIPPRQFRVLRSRDFLCQVFETDDPHWIRLSFCRTQHDGDRFVDGISWDDLQRLKREANFGSFDAVEIFPADSDLVNVANMRHLFVLVAGKFPLTWRKLDEPPAESPVKQ